MLGCVFRIKNIEGGIQQAYSLHWHLGKGFCKDPKP